MTVFPKYDQSKDSGVEWLGDVPEHWEIEKARWMFLKLERPVQKHDGIVTCFRDGQVALRSRRREEGFTMAILEHGYQAVKKGDLVVHGMDAFAGAIGVSEDDGKCTPEYSVLAPLRADINNHYFAHLLRVMAARGYIHIICPSVRERAPRFRFPKLQDNRLPIPTLVEQDRIVAFLDEKTVQIDALIAKKRRQIDLLDEQKAILINRTVTCGLNPNAELQDSGIPWIGPIPKGWGLKRMRYLCRVGTGECDTKDSVPNGDYPFFVRSQTPERINSFGFDCEAILTAGDGAGVGKVFHHFVGRFDCHQRVYVLRDFTEVSGRFLFLYMRENFHRVALTGEAKSTVDSLRRSMLTDFPVPIPSAVEQDAIVKHCDQASAATATLIQKVESQIQTLQTLRSTLIAHAVTGKIKV